MDPAFGNWLAGFIDGEGCFQVRRSPHRLGYDSYRCYFVVQLRWDDVAILREIKDAIGHGSITRSKARRPNACDEARYAVESKAGALRIIEILDEFPLRAKKAQDYAIWRTAVYEWQKITAARKGYRCDWGPMAAYYHEIREVRRFKAPVG